MAATANLLHPGANIADVRVSNAHGARGEPVYDAPTELVNATLLSITDGGGIIPTTDGSSPLATTSTTTPELGKPAIHTTDQEQQAVYRRAARQAVVDNVQSGPVSDIAAPGHPREPVLPVPRPAGKHRVAADAAVLVVCDAELRKVAPRAQEPGEVQRGATSGLCTD